MAKIASAKNIKKYQGKINRILNEDLGLKTPNFQDLAGSFIKKRRLILALTEKYSTPFYLFDQKALDQAIIDFKTAFQKYVPGSEYFYAVKVNHHPWVTKTAVKNGFGLDVSSGRELGLALKAGAKKIIFTGPGKTDSELKLALKNRQKVTINLDSFGELERLKNLLEKNSVPIRLGVRIFSKSQGAWTKFGIPLSELSTFWHRAKKIPAGKIQGIHFHSSWNQNAGPYCQIIRELSRYLKDNFSADRRREIEFIDFGGGFRPFNNEGFYPWETDAGLLVKTAAEAENKKPKYLKPYYLTESVPIKNYAQGIGRAIDKYLRPLVDCRYFSEPGRIICNEAMHLVLKIVDVKAPGRAIADGGINLVGWERFEHDYFPLISLSHPNKKEIKFDIFGSLCMPQDYWGPYCFAKTVRPGDVILVPNQGALTYSLAQNFIKPIAKAYRLE